MKLRNFVAIVSIIIFVLIFFLIVKNNMVSFEVF